MSVQLASAETVTVATAANYHGKAIELASAFEKNTGHKVTVIAGASGVLAAQILNGAPFDVFMSADQKRPLHLIKDGAAVKASRVTYSCGKLFLWAPGRTVAHGDRDQFSFSKVALANPRLAPFGKAAKDALRCLPGDAKPKLVLAANVVQAFGYVASGAVPAGFVAGPQVEGFSAKQRQALWPVPAHCHQPIRQDAVLLARAKSNTAAKAFMAFLSERTTGERCGP